MCIRDRLVPFVDSKGNFGKAYSRDMSCAAARYTEAKLEGVCEELFRDIDKETVDFVPNYDSTTTEPTPVSYTHLDVYKRQLLCKVRLCERGRFRLHPRGRGVVPDAAEVLRGTIWNGLRLAPAVFSGRIIFKRAMPELPRTLRHCIFTGGGVKVDGICSAAFCESAALRQTFRLNCKVTGFARGSPFEERLPPLRGSLSP